MGHNLSSERPLVSAVVPAYNAERYIGNTLRSLITQTYPHMEIVVVDDGSCDATVRLIEEMARFHSQIRIIQQRNSGVAAARNRGMQMSRGALIAPVDADDIWFPDAAEKLVHCLLTSDPSVGLAYGWWVTIDEEGLLDGGFRCSMIEGDVFGTLLCHNFLGNASSSMIRRTCLEEVGGFDDQFRRQTAQGCEDWDLYLRIARRFRFRVVPEFLVGYRRCEGSMSSDASSMARSHQYLLRKVNQGHPGLPRVLYRLSTSSFYLHLAHVCYRQSLPRESCRWLGRALIKGPLFTLVRPGFYWLAAKCVLAIVANRFRRLPRSRDGTTRSASRRCLPDRSRTRVEDIAKRRTSIRMRILAQSILHHVVSRLLTR
ncbi:MAG: glycosyltransferase family 2 protein [Pirellulaceae bacterium]